MSGELHAVIGCGWVMTPNLRTFFVKRSDSMQNYPGVWSLPSIQFEPSALPDPMDLEAAQPIFDRLASERFIRNGIRVDRYLCSGICSDNPMGLRVHLHLYLIGWLGLPALNPAYYTDSGFLTPEEYMHRAEGHTCGLCMRLYSDYLYRTGKVPQRFAPIPILEE